MKDAISDGCILSVSGASYLLDELDRAIRALDRAGYTHEEGHQEWKPPLGAVPNLALRSELMDLERQVYDLKDKAVHAIQGTLRELRRG